MKNDKGIRLGIFLLTVGIIWALVSMGIITWSIVDALVVLWPLLLVVAGVNIIFRRNAVAGAVTWLLFIAVLVSYTYFVEEPKYKGNEAVVNEHVTIERRAETQKGELYLSFGGTNIIIDSNTSNMLDADIKDPNMEYKQNSNNSAANITFYKKSYRISSLSNVANSYNNTFHLNNQAIWNIDMDTGAVNGDLDLSDLHIEKLTVDTGASKFKLKLGDKEKHTKVKLDAGVSKIDFYVPGTAGVKVEIDGGLNATNFDDGSVWEKKGGAYYSKGYDQATAQIDIDVDMGVGKLAVYFE